MYVCPLQPSMTAYLKGNSANEGIAKSIDIALSAGTICQVTYI